MTGREGETEAAAAFYRHVLDGGDASEPEAAMASRKLKETDDALGDVRAAAQRAPDDGAEGGGGLAEHVGGLLLGREPELAPQRVVRAESAQQLEVHSCIGRDVRLDEVGGMAATLGQWHATAGALHATRCCASTRRRSPST